MAFGKFDPRTLGLTSTTFKQDFAMKGLIEVSEALAKVKPESMRNFKEGIQSIGMMFGSPIAATRQGIQRPFTQISAQIGFGFQQVIQPFTNQLSSLVNRFTNATQPFLQRNIIGAGIGATAGAIIGSFIPGVGSNIGAILGGLVGAGIQEALPPGGGDLPPYLDPFPNGPPGAGGLPPYLDPFSGSWGGGGGAGPGYNQDRLRYLSSIGRDNLGSYPARAARYSGFIRGL